MSATPERPAFYALGRGRAAELLTLLHPPYTAWHLSYFALGAVAAPHLHVDRLLWGEAAFALAVGLTAHALDELHDRPLGTALSARTLKILAVVGLLGALAIGVAGAVTVTAWLAPLVAVGGAFVVAYNLELLGGRFHSDLWFALGWGDEIRYGSRRWSRSGRSRWGAPSTISSRSSITSIVGIPFTFAHSTSNSGID